jgi:hypothetical protein
MTISTPSNLFSLANSDKKEAGVKVMKAAKKKAS